MSMTIRMLKGKKFAFDADKASNDLVSLTGMGNDVLVDHEDANTYALATPGAVRVTSTTSTSKKGVMSVRLAVQVPLRTGAQDWSANSANGGSKGFQNKYVQVATTVSIPNRAGVLAYPIADTGSDWPAIDAATSQAFNNKVAVAQGLLLLANLIFKQASEDNGEMMAADQELLDLGVEGDTEIAPKYGTFNENHPLARGFAGILPIDPNTDRGIGNAEATA